MYFLLVLQYYQCKVLTVNKECGIVIEQAERMNFLLSKPKYLYLHECTLQTFDFNYIVLIVWIQETVNYLIIFCQCHKMCCKNDMKNIWIRRNNKKGLHWWKCTEPRNCTNARSQMNGQRNAIYNIAGHHNHSIDFKKIISPFPSILDHI